MKVVLHGGGTCSTSAITNFASCRYESNSNVWQGLVTNKNSNGSTGPKHSLGRFYRGFWFSVLLYGVGVGSTSPDAMASTPNQRVWATLFGGEAPDNGATPQDRWYITTPFQAIAPARCQVPLHLGRGLEIGYDERIL